MKNDNSISNRLLAKKYFIESNIGGKPPKEVEIAKKFMVSRSTIARWKKDDKWKKERDEHNTRVIHKRNEKSADKAAELFIDFEKISYVMAMRALEAFAGNKDKGIPPMKIEKPSDVRNFIELAWKIKQCIEGEPTEILSVVERLKSLYVTKESYDNAIINQS